MKRDIAIGSLTFELQTGNSIQLFPAGQFRSSDNRPVECANWLINAELARRVIERLTARKNSLVIDYEHQTLLCEQNGLPAPAAGWWVGSNTVWRDDGLFAENVEWTDAAKLMIANKEYRYISPVFAYDKKTGEIYDVLNAALTNNPALDGMKEVALAAASRSVHALKTPPEKEMDEETLALLRKLLGLADSATEADILAALKQLTGQMPTETEQAGASLSTVLTGFKTQLTEIAALKVAAVAAASKNNVVDPAKFVPITVVEELRTQLVSLTSRVNVGELDTLIDEGLKSGKLLPSMKDWAADLGKKDIEALHAFIGAAGPIAALTAQQNGGIPPVVDATNGLTAIELQAAQLTGLTATEYAAAKKELN